MNRELVTKMVSPVSIAHRLAARVVDYLVLTAVGVGFGKVIGFGFIWLGITAAITFGYFVAGDAFAGTTIGKKILGLRIAVESSGGRPSLGAAVAREWFVLLGAIPFVGPILALVAWVSMLITIRKSALGQGWHDRLAGGTRVVRR